MKSRLSEIAERSGVSISTVSRVLNDQAGVSERARNQVLTAVDVLGYDRPVRLRPRRAGLVGLVLPELENPYVPRIAHHVETRLARAGLAPVLCSQTVDGVHEDAFVATLLEHGVRGVVFVSGVHALVGSDPSRYQRLLDQGLPIVLVNGAAPDVPVLSVASDDALTVDLAVDHLAQMGHTRIGLALGQRHYVPVQRREAAFRAAAARLGLAGGDDGGAGADDLVACTSYTVEGGALAARRLLDRGVTAIACGSDVMALGVLREARRRGLRVPEDLSVVGSDDSLMVEYLEPALTTVRQPAEALAAAACHELLEQIAGQPAEPGEVLLPPELVVRRSTARVPS